MSGDIGFPEAVSMAVGGMVGGGIFAVLGVVATTASTAAWLAFVASGVVALCAGYSFVRLDRLVEGAHGPIGQIEALTGNTALAGMVGWLFIFGYVGTMAMYAYAFGSYLAELVGLGEAVFGVPVRPLLSLGAVAGFVGLNVVGARASGRAEDVLVASKVLILLLFGVGGLYYGLTRGTVESGVAHLGLEPLTAAALAFVAFEGWELLAFDRDSVESPERTLPRAIYASIAGTTVLYVLVAVVTTNLVPLAEIRAHPETALALAARPFLGEAGFVLISVAAVISTASALNATLFSSARLSRQMSHASPGATRADVDSAAAPDGGERGGNFEGGTPHHRSTTDTDGVPVRTLLVVGSLTSIFALYGDLNSITSFASGAFMTLFGGVCALALRERGDALRTALVPAVGVVGSAGAAAALFWHLNRTDPDVLVTVATIWALVLAVYWVPRRR